MEYDIEFVPNKKGTFVDAESSRRIIKVKNESGKINELYPLVYLIWRKCNGKNTIGDLLVFIVKRTKKEEELMKQVLMEMIRNLRDMDLIY